MMSLSVGSNIDQVAGWIGAVGKKQIPFATAKALTSTAFDVKEEIVTKTYPRAFTVKNQKFASQLLRVQMAKKNKLTASVFDRLGREYLETHARGGIKRPTGKYIAIPTRHIKRTAKGVVSKAKRPRQITNKPNVFFRHNGPTPDIVRKPRGKDKSLEVLYQLVPLARIPKRFNFYEDAAKVVKRRMIPNFRKSFRNALRTAR